MKPRLLSASVAAMALSLMLPAFGAETAQDFVDKAAAGGMFEVDSSKVAIGKAENQAVKEFAQKMIDDHGAANSKLATIAAEQKLQVPTALDAKHMSDLDALNKASAPIDGQYVEMQQAAHADAVALFESYSQNGDNATLKTFATETLPTLKMHKDMVEKLEMDASASGTTEAAAVKTPVATVNPDPGAKGNLASNIIGETVYNSTAEEAEQIGEVNDIVMNANGEATLLIIGVGGFLGVGERDVAIDFNGAEWAEKDGDRWLVVATTKETLEGMEPFDRTPYVITPAAAPAAPLAPVAPADPAAPATPTPEVPKQ